jgi:glycerate kinase
MNILIAPDKFKGSLTAMQVCETVSDALLSINPHHNLVMLPLADGGEGTCELLTEYCKGEFVTVDVRDPLFRKISSRYGISPDNKIAFLEMAKASGLQLLSHEERDPLITSTVGTGDMIRHALDRGVEHIMMGIGGSATNDAGMGMADALGIKFYDRQGRRVECIGRNLSVVDAIDVTGVHPLLQRASFTLFCDVTNPLFGPDGAAYVFAPQKGASIETVRALDEGLSAYARVLEAKTGRVANFPGAGAGGGLPTTLNAFAEVEIRAGMEYISEFIGLEQQIRWADMVITGEGNVDEQTMSGKVVKGVAALASKYRKPLIVIAGTSELDEANLQALSVHTLISLTDETTSQSEAIRNAPALLTQRLYENKAIFK